MTNFIGIDLAWQDGNHHGLTALRGDRESLLVQAFPTAIKSLEEICSFIARYDDTDTVVAIDAPLVIRNLKGQRPCETEISRRFSKAHAGAHTSNLTLYPNATGVGLADALLKRGFTHCPTFHSNFHSGKWFFEVYPHPAHVVLFKREKIIKYKKGPVALRRNGLREFRDSIKQYLCTENTADPPLLLDSVLRNFLDQQLNQLRGQALKHYEDVLDSLFCAYLAAFFWAWGYDRNEMIGEINTGYIVNPKL